MPVFMRMTRWELLGAIGLVPSYVMSISPPAYCLWTNTHCLLLNTDNVHVSNLCFKNIVAYNGVF